jgi:hypothetical protein
MATTTPSCTCFVRYCHSATRYGLRYGAHDSDCGHYRESSDPVDALHDRANREALHAIIARATRPPNLEG